MSGLELRVDDRLRERTNWGDVEGETWDEFLFGGTRRHREVPRPSRRVRRRHRGPLSPATIIAVTHGGIVGDYLGGHQDWPHCGITELEV